MNEIKAKKKFGQNFLKDTAVLHKIVEAMPKNDHVIAEIGPGLGDLTKHLVKIKGVVAFEVDTDLCTHLTASFKEEIDGKRLTLHCGDVLERWNDNSLVDAPYDLVANLPYYIATNIILKALADPMCHNLLVMIQKEVADKFSAQPGEKVFSALSVITQSVGEARTVVLVPPEAFDPPPKIDSAVIRIEKKGGNVSKGFSDFLKIAFAQPRKTLVKNLSSFYPKTELLEILQTLKLLPTIRPHETTTSEYHQIYNNLKGLPDGRDQSR
ncbi:MAG: 16S rRNA (adenine(1518)-N(6)/adenine(1519)-N(6))-dimethyltransferase RsmA [Thiovulaceae bacterium]|nr:16S rRNA (adenine(1518)-N(6)/adenine(1519)-N(6))-dimethyltransferase RsmA [Sulfurimonadaceae bacterium]